DVASVAVAARVAVVRRLAALALAGEARLAGDARVARHARGSIRRNAGLARLERLVADADLTRRSRRRALVRGALADARRARVGDRAEEAVVARRAVGQRHLHAALHRVARSHAALIVQERAIDRLTLHARAARTDAVLRARVHRIALRAVVARHLIALLAHFV